MLIDDPRDSNTNFQTMSSNATRILQQHIIRPMWYNVYNARWRGSEKFFVDFDVAYHMLPSETERYMEALFKPQVCPTMPLCSCHR